MNLLIVNGYDKNGWGKLARYGLQPICEFYRDQLKIINSKIDSNHFYIVGQTYSYGHHNGDGFVLKINFFTSNS